MSGAESQIVPGPPSPDTARAALELISRVSFTVVDRAPMFVRMFEAARHIREAFGADGCVLRELVGHTLQLTACSGMSQDALPGVLSARDGLAAEILETKKPLAMADIPTQPLTASLHSAADGKWFQFTAYAGAPMLVQGKPVGILGIYSCDAARRFTESDLYHLQIVANHLAVCIQNHRFYCELKAQRDQLQKQLEERRQVEIELQCRLEYTETQRTKVPRPGPGAGLSGPAGG